MAIMGPKHTSNNLPKGITSERLLLVEGKDECIFFSVWLPRIVKSVQIINIGGKDQFNNHFPVIMKLPGFNNVQKLGIIRDAEDNCASTFQSIQSMLNNNHMPPPLLAGQINKSTSPHLGVWIMPDNLNTGSIENLCWDLVPRNDPRMACSENFIDCLKNAGLRPKGNADPDIPLKATSMFLPSRLEKTKVQAYLGSLCDPQRELGRAAEAGVWDFGHQRLENLREFLIDLFR
jgi:hypothetical protein